MNVLMNFLFFLFISLAYSLEIDFFNTHKITDKIKLYDNNDINIDIHTNISYYKVLNYSLSDNNFITGNLYYSNIIELEPIMNIISNNFIITKSNIDLNMSNIFNIKINDSELIKEYNNINFNNNVFNFMFLSKNIYNNFDIIMLVIHNYFDSDIIFKQTKCNQINHMRTIINNCFDSYKSIVLEQTPQKFMISEYFTKSTFNFASSYSLHLIQ